MTRVETTKPESFLKTPSIWRNIIWGVRYGVTIAVPFCIVAILVFAIGDSRSLNASGLTITGVLTAYVLSGIAAGGIVGVFRPFLRSRVGSTLVGILASMPVWTVIKYTIRPGSWQEVDFIMVFGLSIVYGVILGPVAYGIFSGRSRPK